MQPITRDQTFHTSHDVMKNRGLALRFFFQNHSRSFFFFEICLMSVKFTLKLGSAQKKLNYVPMPGNPLGAFVYFNMNEEGMSDFVEEGARLIAEHAGPVQDTVLFTAETSTLAVSHVLRTKYGYEVQVMTKKKRPNGYECIYEEYCAVTSTQKSTLYFDACYKTPKKRAVFFDNVCTTGETIKAAHRILMRLGIPLYKSMVFFTEGEQTTSINDVPLISFGHLPVLDLSFKERKVQFNHKSNTPLPTYKYGTVQMHSFQDYTGKTVIVATHKLEDFKGQQVPMRVHDACMTSEVWLSQKCDCREQLEHAMSLISREGGMVIYMPNEGRGIGLTNKFMVYEAQETLGLDTVDANRFLGFPDDIREYLAVKDVLDHFGIQSIRLITNNPRKVEKLESLGIHIAGRIPCLVETTSPHCLRYIQAKAERMNHQIPQILFYEPEDEYGFLSNFYKHPLTVDQQKYSCVEVYYQSQKYTDPKVKQMILDAEGPAEAFAFSRQVKPDADWETRKVETMLKALRAKFSDAILGNKLKETVPCLLVENSPHDLFWGQNKEGQGQNMMGKLLMQVRSELILPV